MGLTWEDITETELKKLFYDEGLNDNQIADLFGIKPGKVTYKRRRFGITIRNKVYQEFLEDHGELFDNLNEESKERILNRENIDVYAKAITHFAFRNGPVEDMHAMSKLSEDDMKTLNKYMVNRMAGLLTAIADNSWLKLEALLTHYRLFGTDWDEVIPDMDEINTYLNFIINKE